jgi:hypothetical protein
MDICRIQTWIVREKRIRVDCFVYRRGLAAVSANIAAFPPGIAAFRRQTPDRRGPPSGSAMQAFP